jgi:hypothetical protein
MEGEREGAREQGKEGEGRSDDDGQRMKSERRKLRVRDWSWM